MSAATLAVALFATTLVPRPGSAQDTTAPALDDLSTDSLKAWISAAEQGNAEAQIRLGILYRFGLGVPEDGAEAARWYRAAAEQGSASAQGSLGFMYANGLGVPKDGAEAVRWYRAAAEQGRVGAQNALGRMYAKRGSSQDGAGQSAGICRRGEGDAGTQLILGSMYARVRGFPKTPPAVPLVFAPPKTGYPLASSARSHVRPRRGSWKTTPRPSVGFAPRPDRTTPAQGALGACPLSAMVFPERCQGCAGIALRPNRARSRPVLRTHVRHRRRCSGERRRAVRW